MAEKRHAALYTCRCGECKREGQLGETAKLHLSINRVVAVLEEKHRRRFVGLLAAQRGYGGVQHLARVTGISRTTILRGRREIEQVDRAMSDRIRAPGGGGTFSEKNSQVC
jgi:hypothetical protein